jgi:Zn-dependent M28 family amino/carboxypeptidase
MRYRISYLFIPIILLGCCNFVAGQASGIDSIINPNSVHSIIETLAADSLKGRLTGSTGEKIAADFIANELSKSGAIPMTGDHSFFVPYTHATDTGNIYTRNVVAMLPGKSKAQEVIIFSAHFDHIGTKNTNPERKEFKFLNIAGDTIYNGANDDASGISAVLSLARYFGSLKNNERTIVFIAFSGEEEGLWGSNYLAQVMNLKNIKAMINIDMIGRGRLTTYKNPYITGYLESDLQRILNKELYDTDEKFYGKSFFKNDLYPDAKLYARSDNYAFSRMGVIAHTIMASSPYDKYYHSTKDEVSTLDYVLIANIIKAIALGSKGLVDGSQTPSRW